MLDLPDVYVCLAVVLSKAGTNRGFITHLNSSLTFTQSNDKTTASEEKCTEQVGDEISQVNTVIPTSSWSQAMFGGILNSTSSFSEEKEEEFEEQKIKLDLVAVHGWPHELHIDEDGVSMPHVLGSTSVQKLEVEESQLEADT